MTARPGPEVTAQAALVIGEYTISPFQFGGFWMQHESGEGMQVKEELLAAAIHAFYVEHF